MGRLGDAVDDFDVGVSCGFGLQFGGDVFSEEVKGDVETLFGEGFGGGEGVFERFAGDKTMDEGFDHLGLPHKLLEPVQVGDF